MGPGKEGGNAEASRGERVGDHLGSGIFQSLPAYLDNSVSLPLGSFVRYILPSRLHV